MRVMFEVLIGCLTALSVMMVFVVGSVVWMMFRDNVLMRGK